MSTADFINSIVRADIGAGVFDGRVQTRFPPEPNGYLHIGHAKSIQVNFDTAIGNGGRCLVRMDDTNPQTEEAAFAEAILADIEWLGYTSAEVRHASDYFDRLAEWAVSLIERGLAYVDDADAETISERRGGFGAPGVDSPDRDRPVAENLDLFARMRAGEFEEGTRVLRAKIDMAHENMAMRDPILYRIRSAAHHRTGGNWAVYPTYDWAHGQSDAIEGVTHSICTLEFETHRPLYDWFLDHLPLPGDRPKQIEFARLELTHTVTSKRRLAKLVADQVVDGWDDPRLPTLSGLRRRGYPPEAILDFCRAIGTTRANTRRAIEELEAFVRRRLNATAQRRMAVLRPLRLVLTGWPDDEHGAPVVERFALTNNPEDPVAGTRVVEFTGELWIEADDFVENPPPKFYRLSPGREVRLRGAYLVTCTGVERDADDRIVSVICSYDPASRGGAAPDGRKVRSTMHWVSAASAVSASVHVYERLFSAAAPGEATGEPMDDLAADSRETLTAYVEPALAEAAPGEVVQFERLGYFARDPRAELVFHKAVGLRDEWAAIQRAAAKG